MGRLGGGGISSLRVCFWANVVPDGAAGRLEQLRDLLRPRVVLRGATPQRSLDAPAPIRRRGALGRGASSSLRDLRRDGTDRRQPRVSGRARRRRILHEPSAARGERGVADGLIVIP